MKVEEPPIMYSGKPGERVEITGNTAIVDGKGTKQPYYGTITEFTGDGYLVRPDGLEHEVHCYYFEVKRI